MLKILITVNFFIEEFLGCFLKTEMMIQYFCGMISEKLKKKNPANIALYNINIPVTLQVNNIDLGLLLVQHVFLFPPPHQHLIFVLLFDISSSRTCEVLSHNGFDFYFTDYE